jgi:predicted dehydrogenase
MSGKIVKVGIIGCGGIAFGKHLPSLAKVKQVELTYFCDIEIDKAEKAKETFGNSASEITVDYKQLLADKEIDVVHICTPNSSHAEITIAALEAGKHVMCEKPMAITSSDAKAMVDASKRTGKKLTIGYQNRFRSDSQYLKQVCENGELGDIYYAKALAIRRRAVPTWGVFLDKEKQGGGPLIDIGTHSLDLTLWMMDNYKPYSVTGSVFHKLGSRKNAANAWGPWDPEKFDVEDSAFGYIKMENGATIVLESSWAINLMQIGEAKTVLCGTEGGADMENGLRLNGEHHSRLYDNQINLKSGGVAFNDSNAAETDAELEARLWIECIINDTEPLVNPEQAYIVTQILEAVYESAKTGKTIYFS